MLSVYRHLGIYTQEVVENVFLKKSCVLTCADPKKLILASIDTFPTTKQQEKQNKHWLRSQNPSKPLRRIPPISINQSKLEITRNLAVFGRSDASNSRTRVWIVVGLGIAGFLIFAETQRRRRRRTIQGSKPDFGAFIERFELLPSPQPPPPAARHPLEDLTFAVSDSFDVEGCVTGFGNPDWKKAHEPAKRTAAVVTQLLKHGAECTGRTVMGEFGFGVSGENTHYGTPTNPETPSHVTGGSSSGSSVAVAVKLVDFALGIDTIGGVRIPASFCGIMGFRPSYGTISTAGVLINSNSLDTVGLFARDPAILNRVGHVLLQASSFSPKRVRRLIFADDCFQLSRVPKQKNVDVVCKAIKSLSGYQSPTNINIGQYIASNVPTLKDFHEHSGNIKKGVTTLKALSTVMLSIQRYEFKTNHQEWINSMKPRLGHHTSAHILAAINSTHENNKMLYKARSELRVALNSLLKDEGILVVPTAPDYLLKLNSSKSHIQELENRAFLLSSIAGVSGCCQVTIPLGKHDGQPLSVSLIAAHGADKFLLDTVLDTYSSIQEQVCIASNSLPLPDINGDMDASELLKEKGNAAFKGRQWNKAASYYSEAIKLNDTNATYYCNRAAVYLELGCFQQAEADCNQAISLDKKNVKAYLRRGTAREMLMFYKAAAQDFRHALVLEPKNKVAAEAEKRLKKLKG